ncbi:SigB/SigF/SigG family RNA polymerase sigma factor [Micromonospora sp. CPCC 206061]|uniref:SigB/SigF/SigG family RNA polymerase sigma factor n=1 Tax=Micromonospora sp. CPCC 206061 TaxID=3122410 RepID=UPI002FF1FEEE
MTILVEPALITATLTHPAEPTTPAASPHRLLTTTLHTVPTTRRWQPGDAPASTEQLLRLRDDLPAEHPDRARLRSRAIEENLSLASRLARRYAGRGELLDDLAQVAALALITAVDRYDPSRQVPFAAYAVPTILGALKRHFRDTAWAMRVPRAAQDLTREIATATGELSQQHGRHPTAAELADHLHVGIDELRAALGASQVYNLVSLNMPHTAGTGIDRIDLLGGIDPHYAGVDDTLTLQLLMAALPMREQRILSLRFFDHMTQTQIAIEVGLSQMHVSRLLKQTLTRLRAAMIANSATAR